MSLDKFQEQLVLAHIDTAEKIAYTVYNTARHILDRDHLNSVAYEGLVEAAKNYPAYCEKKGYELDPSQFYRYARLRIKGAIYDDMRLKERWIGSSRALRTKSKKLRDAGQDQGATVAEMSELTGMSEKDINKAIFDLSKRTVSLEAEEIDYEVVQSTESSATVSFLLQSVVDVISKMDKVSQTILALHYYQKRELQDIAKILDIKERRLSDLHTESVITIKNSLKDAVNGKDLEW